MVCFSRAQIMQLYLFLWLLSTAAYLMQESCNCICFYYHSQQLLLPCKKHVSVSSYNYTKRLFFSYKYHAADFVPVINFNSCCSHARIKHPDLFLLLVSTADSLMQESLLEINLPCKVDSVLHREILALKLHTRTRVWEVGRGLRQHSASNFPILFFFVFNSFLVSSYHYE